MNVAELKKALEGVDERLTVFIRQTNDEFEISMVENATTERPKFTEGGSSVFSAYDKVFIISDEI